MAVLERIGTLVLLVIIAGGMFYLYEYGPPLPPPSTFSLRITDNLPSGVRIPYDLTPPIDDSPETGVTYYLVADQTYTVSMPSTFIYNSTEVDFVRWVDSGSSSPSRTLVMTQDYDLAVEYEGDIPPPPPSGYIAYQGMESTKPPTWYRSDGTTFTWGYLHNPDGYTRSTERKVAGDYSLKLEDYTVRTSTKLHDSRGDFGITWLGEVYVSMWCYLDVIGPTSIWGIQFFEIREWGGSGSSTVSQYWDWQPADSHGPAEWRWYFHKYCTEFSLPCRFEWWISSQDAWRGPPDPHDYPDSYVVANPHEVPLDRWFRLEYYVRMSDASNGAMIVWITDPKYSQFPKILFSIQNVQTSEPGDTMQEVIIMKKYGSDTDAIWFFDEITIYGYDAH